MITMQIVGTVIIVFMLIDSSSDPIHNLPSVVTRQELTAQDWKLGRLQPKGRLIKQKDAEAPSQVVIASLYQYNLGTGSSCDWGA